MRAMSLDSYDKEDEDNELNYLKNRLDNTNSLVLALSKQIEELCEKVVFCLIFVLFFEKF
jgi:hypothetical protein